MNYSKSPQNQVENLYEELIKISKTCADNEEGSGNKESYLSGKFSLSFASGKKFYKSLSDEQLLKVIKDIAQEIGHPPSQKEVFWVWREYIKLRFKKWPYALDAAGLPRNAGSGGITMEQAQEIKEYQNQMINIVREKAKELGRIPHPKDLPEVCMGLSKYMHKWQDIIKGAELDQKFFEQNSLYIINDLEDEYQQLLQGVYKQANMLGRAPQRNELDSLVKEKLVKRCGTWRNMLYQIGLEPVMRIQPFSSAYIGYRQTQKKRYHQNTLHDCYYRVLNLDEQSMADLIFIKKLELKLQHLPGKNEVPADVHSRLQKKCGSWANVLFQIQYVEEHME